MPENRALRIYGDFVFGSYSTNLIRKKHNGNLQTRDVALYTARRTGVVARRFAEGFTLSYLGGMLLPDQPALGIPLNLVGTLMLFGGTFLTLLGSGIMSYGLLSD